MLHLHSTIAIVLLLALVVSIVLTLVNLVGDKPYNRKTALFGLIAAHIQMVIGFVLYFINGYQSMISGETMKSPELRFKIIEHPVAMLLGIIFITIGFSKAKRLTDSKQANKTVVIFYIIGLILILARVPWGTWSLFH